MNNDFKHLSAELGTSVNRIQEAAKALQDIGFAPSDEAIRGVFAIIKERKNTPTAAASIYAAHNQAQKAKANPADSTKFGLIQGAEELGRIAYEQTQVISDQVADDVTAGFVADVFKKVFSGQSLASGTKTKAVLAQLGAFSGLHADGTDSINLSQLTLTEGGKSLPFSSGLLLTASNQDRTESTPEPTPETQIATDSQQLVEA